MLKRILILLGIALAQPLSAENSWESAIESVSRKSSQYYQFALKIDPTSLPGSALHGIGHDRHICAITGRMLGFREEIREAETFDDPPMVKSADPFELMRHSMFLDSWVAAARRATEMTRDQRANLWNLECLGEHGIPRSALIDDPTLRGDFSLLDTTLVVYGDIDSGFFERFKFALEQNPQASEIALGSAGGSVRDAILSGHEIRSRGLSTTLHGPCFSACPLVFAGGVERIIWMGTGPHLGFHQIYDDSGAMSLNHPVYSIVSQYLQDMGVNSSEIIAWMHSATPSEIFEPEFDALCEARIATWVQRICSTN